VVRSTPTRRDIERSNRVTSREQARRYLVGHASSVDTAVFTYVFDRDGFYEQMADRMIEKAPWRHRRRRGHVSCVLINDLASEMDPRTYATLVQAPIRRGLRTLGFPRFLASALGVGASVGLTIALGLTPMNHLLHALRVLIALICPDLSTCPTERDVVSTFTAPGLAGQLKAMAP
jgi:hypothetical protein